MADYLKTFATQADYEAYIAGNYDKPNVSYIEETDETIFTNYEDAGGIDTIVETIKIADYGDVPQYSYKQEFYFPLIVKNAVIPEGVTTIPDSMFSYMPSMSGTPNFPLESIQFPSTLATLGRSNFMYCTSLKEVDLSGTQITVIASDNTGRSRGMFKGCTALESVKLPSTVTTIGSNAFEDCTSLESMSFPSSLTTIDSFAFRNSGLKSADLSGTAMTGIYDRAFLYCTSLTSVTFPSTLQWITKKDASYANGGAFQNCTSLTSIDIPASVTSIGTSTFMYCSSLASVTVRATTPPTLGSNAFNNTHANLVIYVPAESVEAYKAASGWSNYASRIQAIPTT